MLLLMMMLMMMNKNNNYTHKLPNNTKLITTKPKMGFCFCVSSSASSSSPSSFGILFFGLQNAEAAATGRD
jgi:hypothetical protein